MGSRFKGLILSKVRARDFFTIKLLHMTSGRVKKRQIKHWILVWVQVTVDYNCGKPFLLMKVI
jgi:hypothetical protein